MITRNEFAALSNAAEQIWRLGAPRDGAVIDAGSFIGASTLALAEGLSRSDLRESERSGRIWSYDLFRAIPDIANRSLKGEGLKVGDLSRYLYDETIRNYDRYIRTFEVDILTAEKPISPIAILFHVLWNWDFTIKLASLGERLRAELGRLGSSRQSKRDLPRPPCFLPAAFLHPKVDRDRSPQS